MGGTSNLHWTVVRRNKVFVSEGWGHSKETT